MTLFVGDVHGCAEELQRLLEIADADRVVLLGDLFTKGPDGRGVWSLIKEHRCESVLGNHDAAVLTLPEPKLPKKAMAWLRERPLMLRGPGWIAVHGGLNPYDPGATSWRQALNLRRFPDDAELTNPFWWELWPGPELVVYGHDARRGLRRTRREGRLVAMGLDTGCVYGGKLTGWVMEEDRLIQVAAKRVHKAPGPPLEKPARRA